MKIGFAVKELRIRARMSQNELARKSKLTQGYISNVEHGKQQPTQKVIKRLCSALLVEPEVLFIIAMEAKDAKPKFKALFRNLKPAIDSLIDEYLKEVYGRTK